MHQNTIGKLRSNKYKYYIYTFVLQEIYYNYIKMRKQKKENSNKSTQPQLIRPLKFLAFGAKIIEEIGLNLQKKKIQCDISYAEDTSAVNLEDYDSIIYDKISKAAFKDGDWKNIIKYVEKGGSILNAQTLRKILHQDQGQNIPANIQIAENIHKLKDDSSQMMRKYERKQKPIMYRQCTTQKTHFALQEDKMHIISGISSLQVGDACFSSFGFYDNHFIPIINQSGKTYTMAGRFQLGKLLFFGHSDLFHNNFTNKSQNNKIFIANILKWMCGSKDIINVGLLFQKKSFGDRLNLTKINNRVKLHYVSNENQLQNIDILCVSYYQSYSSNLTTTMLQAIKQFVSKGGNLIFTSLGWVWRLYGDGSKNKSLIFEQDNSNYVIAKLFDVFLKQDAYAFPSPPYFSQTLQYVQKGNTIKQFLENMFTKALHDESKNILQTSESEIKDIIQFIENINHKNFQLIFTIELYHKLVDAFGKSKFNIESHYREIKMNNVFYNQVYSIMNALSYAIHPNQCRALAPCYRYPGIAHSRVNKKTVEVYQNRNKLVFTGLYINPGQPVKIRHSHKQNQTMNIKLKINLNNDLTGHNNGELGRFPNISKQFKINNDQYMIATPHGGILYFQVQKIKKQDSSPLIFEIQGAYQAPYWNQQIHSPEELKKIQKINAPFFVIQTQRIILSGPTKNKFAQFNLDIKKLCDHWNNVVKCCKQLRGSQDKPFKKQCIFNDCNIMLGSLHSGYPIMTHQDLTCMMLGVDSKFFKEGYWGFYHELGHNHQDYNWTINQTVEVTVNIYSIYIMEKLHGIKIFDSIRNWLQEHIQLLKEYVNRPSPKFKSLQKSKGNNEIGLLFFAILIDDFGFDVIAKLNRLYLNIKLNTDEEKYDALVVNLSQLVGLNLWHYFKKFDAPVTNKSLQKLGHIKQHYKCKKFPFMTN